MATFVSDAVQPSPVTIATLARDGGLTISTLQSGLLNLIETRRPIDVTGTADPGAQVVVSYNNLNWSATADGEGHWLITIPAEALSEMADGVYPLTVSATDAAGNRAAACETITMALAPPEPTLNTPFGNAVLNLSDVQQPQLLTGTSGASGDNQQVVVNIGGFNVREHTSSRLGSDGRWQLVVDVAAGGANYIAIVDANGNWVLELPPDVLRQLNNGEMAITVARPMARARLARRRRQRLMSTRRHRNSPSTRSPVTISSRLPGATATLFSAAAASISKAASRSRSPLTAWITPRPWMPAATGA